MSDEASCACLKVRQEVVRHEGGTCSERWTCQDCGYVFVRKGWADYALRDAVKQARRLALHEVECTAIGLLGTETGYDPAFNSGWDSALNQMLDGIRALATDPEPSKDDEMVHWPVSCVAGCEHCAEPSKEEKPSLGQCASDPATCGCWVHAPSEKVPSARDVQASWDRLRAKVLDKHGEDLGAVTYVQCDRCGGVKPRELIDLHSPSGINHCKDGCAPEVPSGKEETE